ncbi:Polyadenylate-binding protein RBP45 [Acorus calamus]|uniref:Polyadenylate-binding protein RBP45 n=1 Tax=Acorus calamus TaxID=4465 RepID=A0AAV9DSI0_ACOCL|nr:Polyadenylate-binding protein RBP45 [Acorus calamus]
MMKSFPIGSGAKVVTDRITGRSKGYGFVRFGDANEQTRAMTEMNGVFCSTRPMRIGPATTKKNVGAQQYTSKASYQTTAGTQSENDPNNTTIFVGALDPNVTEDQLRQVFGQYGELVHNKRRGSIANVEWNADGGPEYPTLMGPQPFQQATTGSDPLAGWAQPQADPNQWNGSYYGYNQGYEAYGYAPPQQDPKCILMVVMPGMGTTSSSSCTIFHHNVS